jgi:hypothetical protein
MWKRRRARLALVVGVFLSSSASAADRVPSALVADLLAWIGANSGYDVTPIEPQAVEIVFCEPGERIAYEGGNVVVPAEVRGLYDPARTTITLVRPWSVDEPMDVSTLLHELVHRLQWSQRAWPCVGAPELEAYRLQDRWLREHAVRADFDWVRITLQASCPRDVHP